MQPLNQKKHIEVQARYTRIVVLWFGQLISIGALVCFALFVVPVTSDIPGTSAGPLVRVVLTALGTFFVVVSFPVKRKLLATSVEKQQIDLVQKAFVIPVAMCEVSAVLGMIERFLINERDYYFLFALAAVGIAFHFPRREHLLAATYKASTTESIL